MTFEFGESPIYFVDAAYWGIVLLPHCAHLAVPSAAPEPDHHSGNAGLEEHVLRPHEFELALVADQVCNTFESGACLEAGWAHCVCRKTQCHRVSRSTSSDPQLLFNRRFLIDIKEAVGLNGKITQVMCTTTSWK